MKRRLIYCFLFLSLITFQSFAAVEDSIRIYISAKGKDTNPGTKKAPFLSLERARDAIRALKGQDKDNPVVVYIGEGIYNLQKPLILTSEDSGNSHRQVIYKAETGAKPVFTGSSVLKNFEILKDKQKLNLLDPSVRGKIYSINLKSAGITSYGDPTKAGERPELFCDKQLQTLARWPNGKMTRAGLSRGKTSLPKTYIGVNGTKEGIFEYTDPHQNRWAREKDVRLEGYWYWDWAEEYQKVEKIDTVARSIFLSQPYHGYGYKDSLRYFALNLFCEIDEPGEWYLDRSSGVLYWYPPEGVTPSKAEVTLSVFSDPYMVELKNCAYVTLQGLTFQESRGSAILMNESSGCLIADCRLERFGRDGIHIFEGNGNGVKGCYLGTLGYGGMKISGGDRRTLTPGNHFVENTVVENFSLFKRTYEPAVHLSGCGHRISNNYFRNSSSSAMRLEGNDLLIEYNHVASVVNESDDQGGIDVFMNPSYQGIIIRYNWWTDITGGTRHGAAGVRLDDMISGVYIYGNVFERCGARDFGGVQIHGGKDNIVENNLFYKCNSAVSFSPWPAERWIKMLDSSMIKKKLYVDVDINSPLYLERYPKLKDLRSNPNVNTISNNLIIDCKKDYGRNFSANILSNNLSLQSEGMSLESCCNPDFLKNHGLKPIPLKQIGPRKNKWIN